MNYQQLVSVCSHTGIVILLVASHPAHATTINNDHQPETRVIVVKQPHTTEKA